MSYTPDEIMQYLAEEDVKFIRLAFCDVFGRQKNISVMPSEMKKAFERGIAIDASAIAGFGGESHSDLFLKPDPSDISILPWRPEHGRVVRMFCEIINPDGTPFSADTRNLLKNTVKAATDKGYMFNFGPETEFLTATRAAIRPQFPTTTPAIWILRLTTREKTSAGRYALASSRWVYFPNRRTTSRAPVRIK